MTRPPLLASFRRGGELTYDELRMNAVMGWLVTIITGTTQLAITRSWWHWLVVVGSVFMLATAARATFIPRGFPKR